DKNGQPSSENVVGDRGSSKQGCPFLSIVCETLACIVHAIGGIEDHIHLIVSIPPSLSLADFVKNIKGSSAHHVNHTLSTSANKFACLEGYGVFSLGGKQLDTAVTYVQNQKAHHLNGSAIASLEQETNLDNAPQLWYAK
ncbi:transposase, partial [Hassallia byssoidea VB512170]